MAEPGSPVEAFSGRQSLGLSEYPSLAEGHGRGRLVNALLRSTSGLGASLGRLFFLTKV